MSHHTVDLLYPFYHPSNSSTGVATTLFCMFVFNISSLYSRKEWNHIAAVFLYLIFFHLVWYSQESKVALLCPSLCNPMDCSLPGSSVHGIFQVKILGWVAVSFSRGSSQSRGWIWVSPTLQANALPSEPPRKSKFSRAIPISKSVKISPFNHFNYLLMISDNFCLFCFLCFILQLALCFDFVLFIYF